MIIESSDGELSLSLLLRRRFLKGIRKTHVGKHVDQMRALEAQVGLDSMDVDQRGAALESVRELTDQDVAQLRDRYHLQPVMELFALTPIESRLLTLFATLHADDELHDFILSAADVISSSWHAQARLISGVLGQPYRQVSRALSRQSGLHRMGLIDLCRYSQSLEHRFELRAALAEYISCESANLELLTKNYFTRCTASALEPRHYASLQPDIERVLALLRNAKPGTHILLYGPPGTGKTELAKLFAQLLGWALYAVPSQDDDDDPIEHAARLTAFAQAQRMLSGRRQVLLLFDEVEDVVRSSGVARDGKHRSVSFKGWLHEQLEHAPLPSIWISNSLAGFDDAQLRRFAGIVEVPIQGQRGRRQTVDEVTASLALDDATRAALAERKDISPAELQMAVREAQSMPAPESALIAALNARLRATGRDRFAIRKPASFDPRWVRTVPALGDCLGGLMRLPGARLLLSGPPGSGKTAFATHLAEQLDRPLMVKSASDWLSPWVGETERTIAESFHEAETEGAVLLLDEADSFLAARHSHQQRWERTQVNELLKRLELYPGWFCAATNWPDGLDPAVLRRFDVKFSFDWLDRRQRLSLFERFCAEHEVTPTLTREALEAAMDSLRWLLPGDLAALKRRVTMAQQVTDQDVLLWAQAEVACKPEAKARAMGFTRAA